MQHTRRFSSELIASSFLVLSVLICFWRIIAAEGQLYGSDFVLQFWPWKRFVFDSIWSHGTLPFWNPYVLSGTPSIANIQASIFYPLGFLYYLIPPEFAYGYSTILHCILGSLFMYVFMRSLSVSPWGAFLSGYIFTFNGYFMAHLYAGHLSFIQNYIWIPLVFCFLHQFTKTLRYKWVVFAGLALGTQILGGFPQIAFYTILASLAFGLFQIASFLREKRNYNVIKVGLGLAAAICIGFSLAAVQLLPTLEFKDLSGRAGGVSYWFATLDSLHPRQLIAFLMPDIFGNPVDHTYWLSRHSWNYWETCGYVGIAAICLAFVSPSQNIEHRQMRRFFFALIIFAIFLALGKHNPIYPIVFKLPGFRSFRIPAQILFLYVFSLAVMSGIGLHHSTSHSPHFSKTSTGCFILGGIVFLCLAAALYFRPYDLFFQIFRFFAEEPVHRLDAELIPEKMRIAVYRSVLLYFATTSVMLLAYKKRINTVLFTAVLVAIVVIDLGFYSNQFIKPYEFVSSDLKQRLAVRVKEDSQLGRAVTSSPNFDTNDGALYGIQTVNGYDPLVLKRYILYLQTSQGLEQDRHVLTTTFLRNPNHKFLEMLNVRYAFMGKALVRLDSPLPRAMLTNNVVLRPTDKILAFMESDEFDPRTMVVLDSEDRRHLLPCDPSKTVVGSCRITEYENERLQIVVTSNEPCYLVLSEIHYPGWRAKVDGKNVPILQGNYLFRVIPMEKGKHEVEMVFVSQPFRIGAMVSIITFFSCAVALFLIQKQNNGITKR